MRIIEWFRSKWQQGKALTLEELREEAAIMEGQIKIGIAIATANPNHPKCWDSVFKRNAELKQIEAKIKRLEESE